MTGVIRARFITLFACACAFGSPIVAFGQSERGLRHGQISELRSSTGAAPSVAASAPHVAGDVLFLDDFVGFHACALVGGGPGCEPFDFNGDGQVNLLDYAEFMIRFLPGQQGDTCAGPKTIAAIPFTSDNTNCGFTDDYDEICDFNTPGAPDVVYAFSPTSNVIVNITLCRNSNYDSKLYVYEDVCGVRQSDTAIACNDDDCFTPSFTAGAWVSQLPEVPLFAGHTYYIVIDGYDAPGDPNDGCGLYTLDVSEATMVCPGTGSCFVAHATPGCEDETCCGLVCAADAFCCGQNIEGDGVWDPFCVQAALSLCGPPPPPCPGGTLAGAGATAPTGLWVAGASDLGWFAGAVNRLEEFSAVGSPICQVRWWGVNARTTDGDNYDPCVKNPDSYRVRFHADNLGEPGAVVCDHTLTPTRTVTATSYATAGGDLYPLIQYDATLPACCSLGAGWVSVQGLANVDNCVFLWMSSGQDGEGFHIVDDGASTVPEVYDLSFCLLAGP
ncbi:MAG: hypothetical protein HOP29_16110 [Phycisphaerales bacterium]|nr:hypothetical protein [Phycisphaerales bacterium]